MSEPDGTALPTDYDSDPDRYRLGMGVSARYGSVDLYETLAGLLRDQGARLVLDIGCAEGALVAAIGPAAIGPASPRIVGLDRSTAMLRAHPIPAVCANGGWLPFRAGTFDAVTAVNMLYHVGDPVVVIAEAHRVLRRGGTFLAATQSRRDSPELAGVWTPGATTFDAEEAPDLVARVFGDVRAEHWDAPLVTLPDPAAVRDYLVARFVPAADAAVAAARVSTPLRVTKRGVLVHGRR